MGRLIPAGTGLPLYSDTDVEINAPEIEVPEAPITDNIWWNLIRVLKLIIQKRLKENGLIL